MASPILSSPPLKTLLLWETKSSSLSIWSSNFHRLTQCNASYKVASDGQRIARRSANYKPSIWTNDYIQSLNSEYKEEMYAEQGRVLREQVRMMLCKMENEFDQLEFIDVLQRLGVDYHFSNEIRNTLDNIYNTQTSKYWKNNLYVTSLKFRLFRQHGYNISTGYDVPVPILSLSSCLIIGTMLFQVLFYNFQSKDPKDIYVALTVLWWIPNIILVIWIPTTNVFDYFIGKEFQVWTTVFS